MTKQKYKTQTKLPTLTREEFRKYTNDTEVSWLVLADIYSRGEETDVQAFCYKGKLRQVLIDMLNCHSYGYDEEDEEQVTASVQDLLHALDQSNGDGCDFIQVVDLINQCVIISQECMEE